MNYAPIALFTYNRPDKTQRVLESLMQNAEAKDSDLYIFSDGPKNEKAVEGVQKNREYLKFLTSNVLTSNEFKTITIIEREKNWGLANSLIAGITEVINKYGKVIVVEDDLVLSPYFLKFMNEGLEKYKDEEKVGAISAYIPPVKEALPETFFLTYFHCWGWATWKRGWNLLNTDTKYLLRKLRFKKNKFDVGGAYGNLYCQKVGLVDSWWVRLYASYYLADKLILYPGHSLVMNMGKDGSGTHSVIAEAEENTPLYFESRIKIKDIELIEDTEIYNAIKIHFAGKNNKTKILRDIYLYIRRLLYIDCR